MLLSITSITTDRIDSIVHYTIDSQVELTDLITRTFALTTGAIVNVQSVLNVVSKSQTMLPATVSRQAPALTIVTS